METSKTSIPHLRYFKYRGKNISRFRIVKLSNKQFRVDYCMIPFFNVWDKNIKVQAVWISGVVRTYYKPMIFEKLEDAMRCVKKASRKLITFKTPEKEIYKFY